MISEGEGGLSPQRPAGGGVEPDVDPEGREPGQDGQEVVSGHAPDAALVHEALGGHRHGDRLVGQRREEEEARQRLTKAFTVTL